MEVWMPERILDRHVGGNTTYARHVAEGVEAAGHTVRRIPAGHNPAATLLKENLAAWQGGEGLLHYVADTGPLLGTRRPSVVTVHGVASRWIDVARSPLKSKIWSTRVSRAIRSVNHVITVSESSARDVQEVFGVPPEGITTIPHGIDVDQFSTRETLSDEVRQRVAGPFVLYLGNIEPRKNLDPLVRAFGRPEVRELGAQLVIAGKPAWDYDSTMRLIEDSPNVTHLGFVADSDRVALMQHCEVFAFPSLYEGFGFPVVEALAAGAVVVASRRGSLAEVAGPSLAFEELDETGIAAGLVRALKDTDSQDACRRDGLAWAQRFSWQASVDAHIDVYERVLAGGYA